MRTVTILAVAVLCLFAAPTHSATAPATSQATVVFRKAFRGETGSMAPVTLLTPTSSGFYRVSVYEDQSNASGGYFPEVFLSWTDDFTSYQQQMGGGMGGSSGTMAYASDLAVVFDLANQPLQLSTVVNPAEQGTYNLYVVVERF